jgi:short-subunit dehydrogenase
MKQQFIGKVIAITGGTSGIGLALCNLFLKEGASVAVCARDNTKLQSLRKQNSVMPFLGIEADVSKEEDCTTFIETTIQHFGKIDILVNNAGISMRALFEEVDIQVLKQSMDINFWGTVYCTKKSLPSIIENKGSIVGISSIAGYKGLPCRTGYSASKFAMQGFLESLRIELLYRSVNVLWICPGFVASNIRQSALNAAGEKQTETPLSEASLMSAEECAQHIFDAIRHRKRSLMMSAQGKLTVWLNRLFPNLADKMVYRHFAKEPGSPLK